MVAGAANHLQATGGVCHSTIPRLRYHRLPTPCSADGRTQTISTMATAISTPNATVYVANIDWKIKKPLLKRALYSLFSRHGKVGPRRCRALNEYV